jgi:hypothetical protein
VILEGRNRSPGEAHAPSLAGLGARANDVSAPILPTGKGVPHVQGWLGGLEINVFPAQRQ